MNNIYKTTLLLIVLSPAFATDVTTTNISDSIAIPVGSQSEELRRTILLPEFGQSMQSVVERLGPPQAAETIGKPAISKWRYKDMTVYFEGKTVLRSVVHFQAQQPENTAIATKTQ